MPKKKEIDSKALIKAVESGLTRKKIMAQFGFKIPGQVTTYYLDALIEAGRARGIVGRPPKAAGKEETVKVNQRGSISVPKEMIERMGFKEGDRFQVGKTRAGIILKTK
ncbi:MAG: AbrB/MazE/SpoVT family DNA-binding domain-containing protein [Candidatus Adiutricales bacterium]